MSSNFPTSIDTFTDPTATGKLNSPSHSQQHINNNDAIEKLEAKVGVDGSAVTTTHDYKLSGVTGSDKAASLDGTETFTNKTHTLPKINENVALTASATELNLLDGMTDIDTDSTMAADSDTVLPTQKAVKAAIAAKVINRAFSWCMPGVSIDGEAEQVYICPQDMTVVQTQAVLTSGTCTVTLKNGTSTINAISCSNSLATDTTITSTAISKGDLITLTISSASSPLNLKVTMECTQP